METIKKDFEDLVSLSMKSQGLEDLHSKLIGVLYSESEHLTLKELSKIPTVPGSLGDSLNALEKDHKFLTKGSVFTDDLI